MTNETDEAPTPTTEPTFRQRIAARMLATIADDLDRGTVAEQHTAALLHLAADAVTHGYDGELGRAMREWAAAREAAPAGQEDWVDGWAKWNAEPGV